MSYVYSSQSLGPMGTVNAEYIHAWLKLSGEGDPHWPDTQVFFTSTSSALDFGLVYPSIWRNDRLVSSFEHFYC